MSNERRNRIYCMGSLIETYIGQKSAVKLVVYKFSKVSTGFTASDKLVLNTTYTDLTIEDVGSLEDPDSGIIKPYIFVHSARSAIHFLLIAQGKHPSETGNKLLSVCQLQNTGDKSWVSKSFKVLDGNLLLWQCATHIHVGFTNDEKEARFRRQSFPCRSSAHSDIIHFTIVSAVVDHRDIFVFIRCVCKSKHSDDQNLAPSEETILQVLILKQNVDGIWIDTETDSTKLLPKEYASCILDMKATVKNRKPSGVTDGDFDSAIVLLLEGGYIVELINGCSKKCYFVGDIVSSPKNWKFVHVFDRSRCVLRISDTDIIAVDVEKRKVIHTWSDVSSSIVGDFLQCGSPQLLLIFEDGSDEEIQSWLITDFNGSEIDSRNLTSQDVDHGEAETQKAKAAEALYQTLQSSTANLCKAQQHLADKVKFLHNTWQQLHLQSRGREATLQKYEVPLVPLVNKLSKDKSLKSAAKCHMNKRLDLVMNVVWTTTVGSQLIIGVDVHNTTDKALLHCSLSLVPCTKLAESQVKASLAKCPPYLLKQMTLDLDHEHNLAKRLKMDSDISLPKNEQEDISLNPCERVTLAVSTDFADATFQDGFKVWVFLNMREKSSAVIESGDHVGCEEQSELRTLCCGIVSMTTQEFVQGSLAMASDFSCSGQDLANLHTSLSAVQIKTSLEVTSTFTDLTQMLSILQSQTGFQLVADLNFLCNVSCPLLQYVRIQKPIIISKNLVDMSVWTRGVSQLHLTVLHLTTLLPDDITISQRNEDALSSVHATWSQLSEEMKTSSMAAKALLNESSQNVKTVIGSSSSLTEVKQDLVTEFWKCFSEQQMAGQKLKEGQLDRHTVKVIRDLIKRTQKKSDKCVASMKYTGF